MSEMFSPDSGKMSAEEAKFHRTHRRLYRWLASLTALLLLLITVGFMLFFNSAGGERLLSTLLPTPPGPLPALGMPISEADLLGFDLIVDESGTALPTGSGTAAQGQAVYAQRCASCHGAEGEGTIPNTRLTGGDMHSVEIPLRTVGSYWPHTTTLFDYVRRAMPADAPKSLSDDEVYQVTAYLLFLNGIITEETTVDAASLPAIVMPNADGFIDRSQIH